MRESLARIHRRSPQEIAAEDFQLFTDDVLATRNTNAIVALRNVAELIVRLTVTKTTNLPSGMRASLVSAVLELRRTVAPLRKRNPAWVQLEGEGATSIPKEIVILVPESLGLIGNTVEMELRIKSAAFPLYKIAEAFLLCVDIEATKDFQKFTDDVIATRDPDAILALRHVAELIIGLTSGSVTSSLRAQLASSTEVLKKAVVPDNLTLPKSLIQISNVTETEMQVVTVASPLRTLAEHILLDVKADDMGVHVDSERMRAAAVVPSSRPRPRLV